MKRDTAAEDVMKRARGTVHASALAAVLLLLAPATARADESPPRPLSESLTGPAKTDYDIGKILFRDGGYQAALVKFQAAYDASKDARLLYNIAACERNMNHYARALLSMRAYVRGGGPRTEEEKRDAEATIAQLEPLTGVIAIETTEPGANVVLDGELIGQTPLSEITRVDFGKHTVSVTKQGFDPVSMEVEVRDGTPVQRSFALERAEGRLVVEASERDRIDVDGKFVSTGRLEVALAYGGHQLTVTSPGFKTFKTEVVIQSKQPRLLKVTLEKEKGGGIPWWGWTIGGVALAGAGVATYFALKPSSSSSTSTTTSGFAQVPGSAGSVVVHGW